MYMSQKRIAADLLKCGVSRVRIIDMAAAEEALTRQDVRNLIRKGAITKIRKKGTSRGFANKQMRQKAKGRRSGEGSRRGTFKARTPPKADWIRVVRSVRKTLKKFEAEGKLEKKDYNSMYRLTKGGTFRSRRHVINYLKDHELLRKKEKPIAKKKKAEN